MGCMRQGREYDLLNEADLIQIFEDYHKRVYSYFYYRTNNQSISEDLTSQVFEKVIQNRTSYIKERAPLEVWLFAITRNCLNNYFRQQKRHRFAPLEAIMEMISSKETPEECVLIGERNLRLRHSLNLLNERERNIIALKFGAQLNNREIAQIVELSETNVGSILYRSMKKLKKEMEKEDVLCLKKA